MSANNHNDALVAKNDRFAMDQSDPPIGLDNDELSQDELNNVSGGLRAAMKDQQPDGRMAFGPDGKAAAARPSDDPSDRTVL